MIRRPVLLPTALPLLIASLILIVGCAAKTAPSEELPDEELYIDAKLGVTILHPLTWRKQTLPVASPAFRPDAVRWTIPAATDPGDMELRVMTGTDPEQTLENLLRTLVSSPEGVAPAAIEHPLGTALSAARIGPQKTRLLYIVQGNRARYLLTFEVDTAGSEQLLPAIERTVRSLREL